MSGNWRTANTADRALRTQELNEMLGSRALVGFTEPAEELLVHVVG